MAFSFKNYEVILKKGKAKPFWFHHPWIFSGAIKDVKGNPEDGDVVTVFDDERNFVAKGFFNSKSQLRVRLLTWNLHEKIDRDFFCTKIRQAIDLREKVLRIQEKTNAYRLIHSEGDYLSGLTVDSYAGILSIQITSAGMEKRREMILEALKKETSAQIIVERYGGNYRKVEGLEEIAYLVHIGEAPETVEICEHSIRFLVHLARGQKTGFYLDQRENRYLASQFAQGARVLDCFCYSGGFGVYLGKKGHAKEVVFLDASSFALSLAEKNAQLNGFSKCSYLKKDVFKDFSDMHKSGEKFDCIVLDPPKLLTEMDSKKMATDALISLNAVALQMLHPSGVLITCDCSGQISMEEFLIMLNRASLQAGIPLKILHKAGAAPDHPLSPTCLESDYLKTIFCTI